MTYDEFLRNKLVTAPRVGFEAHENDLNPNLFDWQKPVARFSLQVGNVLGALAVGLGKTILLTTWCKHVQARSGGKVLIVCPLAVTHQTIEEARRLTGIEIAYCRNQAEANAAPTPFAITNQDYILSDDFDPSQWAGLALDEASKMLKAFTGKTRQKLTYEWSGVPWRSGWTATPSPNRLVEILNYAEFLGVMTTGEALTRWFVRDSTKANELSLNPNGEWEFWPWLASWCVMMDKPSAIGFPNDGYDLPRLNVHYHQVKVDQSRAFAQVDDTGQARMFLDASLSATSMWAEKRQTLVDRVQRVVEIIEDNPGETWPVLCETSYEEQALARAIPGAVVVTGSQDVETKQATLKAFNRGEIKRLISKPSIVGYGLNWQYVAHNMIFCGPTHKWEQIYQAMSRIYRFGQEGECNIHMVYAESEVNIVENLDQKQKQYEEIQAKMTQAMSITGLTATDGPGYQISLDFGSTPVQIPNWLLKEEVTI